MRVICRLAKQLTVSEEEIVSMELATDNTNHPSIEMLIS